MLNPDPATNLQVNNESDLQNDPEQLEKMIRTDDEELANPWPDITTLLLPVVGVIAVDTN